jgi:uncharacterized delta-60 repeat protein
MKTKISLFIFCFLFLSGISLAQTVTLDSDFGENGISVMPVPGEIFQFNFDNYGNILAIGNILPLRAPIFIKTDANGNLDESFGTNGIKALDFSNSQMYDFKIINDNKILLVGRFSNQVMVMQFNEDGSMDESFGNNGRIDIDSYAGRLVSVNIEKNDYFLLGEVIHGTWRYIQIISKFKYNGERDGNFGNYGEVALTDLNGDLYPACIKVLSDQSILVAGYDLNHGRPTISFCKLNQNGKFVTDFADNGKFKMSLVNHGMLFGEAITDVFEESNGKLIFVGFCGDNSFIMRTLPNGIVDSTFGENGVSFFNTPYHFSNTQHIFLGRNFLQKGDSYLTGWYDKILCSYSNGTLNTHFNNTGIFNCNNFTFRSMGFQKNNKLIVGGGTDGKFSLARINIPSIVSIKEIDHLFESPFIFPNPANDILYFKSEKQFEIFDIQGKMLLKPEKPTQSVNVSHLKSGVYLIKFEDNQVEKFVKK